MYKFSFILSFILLLTFGCQKNELKNPEWEWQCPVPVESRDGMPTVQVADSTLVFQSLEQYAQVRAWVQTATVETLMAWQQNLGFKSSRYYYEEAMAQQCCPDEEGNIAQIAAAYAGKIIYNSEENDISPLLPFVTTGWLLNHRGDLKIGTSLVHYTPNHVFCILDGNPNKLATAIANPVDNSNEGIYVHPTVSDRGGCCAWNLDAPSVSTGNSNGSKRIKTAWVTNWDESVIISIPNLGTTYGVFYTYAGYFHHQKRVWPGVWSVCQRTKWNYTAKETATVLGIPPGCASCIPSGFSNPVVININNVTTGNECKYNFERTVFAAGGVPPTFYFGRGLCVTQISLNTKALDSNLSTSNECKM